MAYKKVGQDMKVQLDSPASVIMTNPVEEVSVLNPTPAVYQSSQIKKTNVLTANFPAATDVLLAAANPNRKAFAIYNNSTSSMYVCVDTGGSAPNQIGQCASNAGPTAHFYSGQISSNYCYTGPIYGRRNSGSGGAWVVEFE